MRFFAVRIESDHSAFDVDGISDLCRNIRRQAFAYFEGEDFGFRIELRFSFYGLDHRDIFIEIRSCDICSDLRSYLFQYFWIDLSVFRPCETFWYFKSSSESGFTFHHSFLFSEIHESECLLLEQVIIHLFLLHRHIRDISCIVHLRYLFFGIYENIYYLLSCWIINAIFSYDDALSGKYSSQELRGDYSFGLRSCLVEE